MYDFHELVSFCNEVVRMLVFSLHLLYKAPSSRSDLSRPLILRLFHSRSSLNAKLDETMPLKCDDPYITPSMVSLSAPVVTSSDGHGSSSAAYSQSNIVRVSAL